MLGAAEYYDAKRFTLKRPPSSTIGDNVIEYEIMPIQELIKKEHIKLRLLVQEAVDIYLNRKSKFNHITQVPWECLYNDFTCITSKKCVLFL